MARPKGQSGLPKSGGRVKGSLDRSQRQVVTNELARDILDVYQGLGGVAFLLEWAKENKTEFVKQALARLMPAYAREGDAPVGGDTYNQFNVLSDRDAAMRIAFIMAKGLHDMEEEASGTVLEQVAGGPYEYDPPAASALDDTKVTMPVEAPDPARDAWAQSLASTPEEQLVQNTKECTIENYPGSAAERGVTRSRRRELL